MADYCFYSILLIELFMLKVNNCGYSFSGGLEYATLPQIKHLLVPEELFITRNVACPLTSELNKPSSVLQMTESLCLWESGNPDRALQEAAAAKACGCRECSSPGLAQEDDGKDTSVPEDGLPDYHR